MINILGCLHRIWLLPCFILSSVLLYVPNNGEHEATPLPISKGKPLPFPIPIRSLVKGNAYLAF